jgi:mono/diheme cytochrome c family protein
MNRFLPGLAAASMLLALAGCPAEPAPPVTPGQRAPAPSETPPPAAPQATAPTTQPEALAQPAATDAAAQAKQIFTTRCVICHGADGKGQGPTAAALNPKPRDYTDAEWQRTVTDEHLAKAIVGGGPAVGMSPLMPANPDLADKPEVVSEIVKLVRAFGQ